MTPLVPERLMQYYDGELPEAEAAEVEQQLRADSEARAALAQLEQVTTLVRGVVERRAARHDDLADRVMDHVAPSSVAVGRKPRRRRVQAGSVAAAAAAVVALAAAAVMWVQPGAPSAQPQVARGVPDLAEVARRGRPAVSTASALSARPQASGPPASPVAIETIDFGSRSGTVFMVPAGRQEVTPVVWMSEEPGASDG